MLDTVAWHTRGRVVAVVRVTSIWALSYADDVQRAEHSAAMNSLQYGEAKGADFGPSDHFI